MPFSLGKIPNENEIECPRCGEIFEINLSACPNCRLNLYEPDQDLDSFEQPDIEDTKIISIWHGKIKLWWKQITKQNYTANELFGISLDNAFLYDQLLQLTNGDHKTANRLIDYEQKQQPQNTRKQHIQTAIDRINRDRKEN